MAGIQFPKNEKGERSTTSFQKAVFTKVAGILPGEDALVQSIASERDWRHRYDHWYTMLLRAQVKSAGSAETMKCAMDSLSAGLEQASALEFERPDGTTVQLKDEMAADVPELEQFVIKGTGQSGAGVTYVVPYKGADLQGVDLASQVQAWADYGTMEQDCAAAVQEAAGKMSCLPGKSFVILGAGSELGPLRSLLRAGATVYAVGTKKPQRWAELIEFARSTAGTLIIPVPAGTPSTSDPSLVAGADLMKNPGAVKTWVLNCIQSASGNVTIGTYLYADSDANVRITAAADYIIEAAQKLGKDRVSFAWLGSPATAHIVPSECVEAQQTNVGKMSWWLKMWPWARTENEAVAIGSGTCHVYKGYAIMQGPNYALAQHMRQWRAMLLHMAGFTVSSPMAPPCRTESVCHNKTMATYLDGLAYFPPCEAFEPDTANALMFGLLVSDLAGEKPAPLATPFHLFTRKSFNGGSWRTPYNMESAGKAALLLGKLFPKKSN